MQTLARSPVSARDAPEAGRQSRRWWWAVGLVVVVAAIVVAVVAIHVHGRNESSVSNPVPPNVDAVLDEFTDALQSADFARLQGATTRDFRLTQYVGATDGPPWREVFRLQRFEVWRDGPAPDEVRWEIDRGAQLVVGGDPWYVAEHQIWRNEHTGVQRQGVASFVVVAGDDDLLIAEVGWSAQAEPLQFDAIRPATSTTTRRAFARWVLGRFVAAGLDPPDARVVWVPPTAPECRGCGGFATWRDPAEGERHTVTLCFDDPESLLDDNTPTGWSTDAMRYGLHEHAHVWMYDRVRESTRTEFLALAGIDHWRGAPLWGELGVEHAAETIAWGIAGSDIARYDIVPRPTCAELSERFEVLTGRPPFTSCENWTPV